MLDFLSKCAGLGLCRVLVDVKKKLLWPTDLKSAEHEHMYIQEACDSQVIHFNIFLIQQ